MVDRLTAAEEHLAHLARSVEELSEVVHRQEAEIARLVRQVTRLTEGEAERERAEGGGIPLRDERPPHW